MGFATSASRSRSTSWSSTFCGAFPAATRPCGLYSHTSSRHLPSCRSVMPLPLRSSPGATTHLPRPCLHPLLLVNLSLPHHRPPPRRWPLSLVLLPRAKWGWGAWRVLRQLWMQWWVSWGSWDAAHPGSDPPSRSSSRRCALADCLPLVVRAYLHVALPRSRRGTSSPAPAGGHGHECCLLGADRDSTSSAQLVVAEGGGIRLPWRSPSALWG
jgi:hypothetical protein